jgi:hypothetical protein
MKDRQPTTTLGFSPVRGRLLCRQARTGGLPTKVDWIRSLLGGLGARKGIDGSANRVWGMVLRTTCPLSRGVK